MYFVLLIARTALQILNHQGESAIINVVSII